MLSKVIKADGLLQAWLRETEWVQEEAELIWKMNEDYLAKGECEEAERFYGLIATQAVGKLKHKAAQASKDLKKLYHKSSKLPLKINTFESSVESEEIVEFLPQTKQLRIKMSNNFDIKIIGIGSAKGKHRWLLLRRICALANAGGGILFWGVNEETHEI